MADSNSSSIKRKEMKAQAKKTLMFQGIRRYCVLYLKGGKEHRSPWFLSRQNANIAFEIMRSRYGQAIIFID